MKARNLARLSSSLGFAVACIGVALSRSGHAQSEPFYSGKTVRIIVGSTPGGFYDRWARLLSRYIPQFRILPATPTSSCRICRGRARWLPPIMFTICPSPTG